MSTLDEDQAVINYYLRRNFYQHVITYCDNKLKKKLSEPTLIFWRAFALIKQDKATEALRELEHLQEKRDMVLVFPLACIFAHESCKLVDREAVDELQARLTIASSGTSITERAYTHAATFCMHVGRYVDAKSYITQALKLNGNSSTAYTLLGWCDMSSPDLPIIAKSNTWFDTAIDKNSRDLDALVGRMTFMRKHRKLVSTALDIANQIIVFYQSFIPAYVDRMYMFLELAYWDQAMESAQQIIAMSSDNIDALCVICLNEMCREGGAKMALEYLNNLLQSLIKVEPRNADLFYTMSRPFTRLANRNTHILDFSQRMVDRALSVDSSNSNYHTELAYIMVLQGQYTRAREYYTAASKLDPHNVTALIGLIHCQIMMGEYQSAQDQLDILNELQKSMGKNAHVSYLNSVLCARYHKDTMKRLQYLKETVELQLQVINSQPLGLNYYVEADPDFLMTIVRDYMDHCVTESSHDTPSLTPVLRIVQDLLEVVCRIVPASTEALYFLAKAKLVLGDNMSAEVAISSCLKLDSSNSRAHLLMAEIHMSNNRYKPAISSLEMALSYDFEVRQKPVFHLLKARALKLMGSFDEAVSVIKTAMSLPAVKSLISDDGLAKKRDTTKTMQVSTTDTDKTPTLSQLASLYIELIDIYTKQTAVHDATRIMQDALRVFNGTSEEPRIMIADADLYLSRNNVDQALNILNTIQPTNSYYLDAKSRMARIYLDYKHDTKSYAQCYSDMVALCPTVDSCLLLGDAYMRIQEPDKSVSAYQSALNVDPTNTTIARKLGQALIKTHDYDRAVGYYESALQGGTLMVSPLCLDLIDLLIRLKRFDEAERVVMMALDHPAMDEPRIMIMDTKLHIMHAKVMSKQCNFDTAFNAYMNARDMLVRMVNANTTLGGHDADIMTYTRMLSDTCYELAQLCESHLKDTNRAITFYTESTTHTPMHEKSLVAMTHLYLRNNDLDAAQTQLSSMIKSDIAVTDATLMMAEIMYRRGSYQQSMYHFKQLIEKPPIHFEALCKLIDVARRNGTLGDIEPILNEIEANSPKTKMSAGYHYCRGLYYRYTFHTNDALKEFVVCRRDSVWGERALYQMIELFLNPDDQVLGGEVMDSVADHGKNKDKESQGDNELLGILTADKLLKELPQNPKSLKTQLLESLSLLLTRQKPQIDHAMSLLTTILTSYPDSPAVIYTASVGFMLQKQVPRARNLLKRITKTDWTIDIGDDLEKCWLLLSDIYIQGGKYDLATELLKKIVSYNKSLPTPHDYLGHIMEKECSYADACTFYATAWGITHKRDPVVGFKLAFNYLKAKRYVDAVDTCLGVLKECPGYPKIEKDVLEKARSHLRCP